MRHFPYYVIMKRQGRLHFIYLTCGPMPTWSRFFSCLPCRCLFFFFFTTTSHIHGRLVVGNGSSHQPIGCHHGANDPDRPGHRQGDTVSRRCSCFGCRIFVIFFSMQNHSVPIFSPLGRSSSSPSNKNDIDIDSGNAKCADCGMKNPQWASVSFGTVFCLECSGVHRCVHASSVLSHLARRNNN